MTIKELKSTLKPGTTMTLMWSKYSNKFLNVPRTVKTIRTTSFSLWDGKIESWLLWPKKSEFSFDGDVLEIGELDQRGDYFPVLRYRVGVREIVHEDQQVKMFTGILR